MIIMTGAYSCIHCLNPGIQEGRLHWFPLRDYKSRDDKHLEGVWKFLERQPPGTRYMGFKTRPIIDYYVYSRLPIITTIDNLHLVENLATFTIVIHIGKKKNKENPWYIGGRNNLDILDKRIINISVSNSVMMDLIPISRFTNWKGYHCKVWLVLLMVPVLEGVLDQPRWEVMVKLSKMIALLCMPSFDRKYIDDNKAAVNELLKDIAANYSEKVVNSYLHLLTHVWDMANRYGPSKCYSMWGIESFQGIALDYNFSTKKDHSGKSMLDGIRANAYIRTSTPVSTHPDVKAMFDFKPAKKSRMDHLVSSIIEAPIPELNSYVVGRPVRARASADWTAAVQRACPRVEFDENVAIYKKVYHNSIYFNCTAFKTHKQNNYTIEYMQGKSIKVGFIQVFVVMKSADGNNYVFFIVKPFVSSAENYGHLWRLHLTDLSDNLDAVSIFDVKHRLVPVKIEGTNSLWYTYPEFIRSSVK
jgi:hypothetical protein